MEPQIYLYFNGRCEEAMGFYADLFGGEVLGVYKNSDAPDPADRMPGGDDLVMNMALRLGEATMMASDAPDEQYNKPQGFAIAASPTSVGQAKEWFEALSEGGEVTMPFGETFWAERFGMVRDRFGTPWMVNYEGSKGQG